MGHEKLSRSVRCASEIVGRSLQLVTQLRGGTQALTVVARDGEGAEYVVRRFPVGDPAVAEEIRVLERLGPLGGLVPHLVAYSARDPGGPVVVTTKVEGEPPVPELSPMAITSEEAGVLARVHAIDGDGLRRALSTPPLGDGPAATAARRQGDQLDRGGRVLVHYDFWCGNTLWRGGSLPRVVDWSGARHGHRAIDVAWCRQDLVLLGSVEAADSFLSVYSESAQVEVEDMWSWDLEAAGHAEAVVETWASNYEGIGRPEITGAVLRERLDAWIGRLLG